MHRYDACAMGNVIAVAKLQRRVGAGCLLVRRARGMVHGLAMAGDQIDACGGALPFVERGQDHVRMHLRNERVELAQSFEIDRAPGEDLADPGAERRGVGYRCEVLDGQPCGLACTFHAAQSYVETVK